MVGNDPAPRAAVLARVEDEITFFMEKTFQISFGYVGALGGLIITVGLDIGSRLASEIGVDLGALLSSALLLLNAVYLSLASGTLFATVKRGLFLVLEDPSDAGPRKWETFVRVDHSRRSGPFHRLTWNIDNFYMVPLFALICSVSLGAATIGLSHSSRPLDYMVVSFGLLAHLIPGYMLAATGRLTTRLMSVVADRTV